MIYLISFKDIRFGILCHTLPPRDFRSTNLNKEATNKSVRFILALLRWSKHKLKISSALVEDLLRFVPLKTRGGSKNRPLWWPLRDSEPFVLKTNKLKLNFTLRTI